MKRTLSLIFGLLLFASPAFAVDESCEIVEVTVGAETYAVYSGVILLKCTAASDDHLMNYTFGAAGETGGRFMGIMNDRRVVGAFSYDGATTDPTTDSDLTITDSDGVVLVNASTNGKDVIDDGDDHSFYFLGPDGNAGYPVAHGNKPWTVLWSNQLVNSAENYLRLEVTGPKYVKY